jgi:hypothetical protein
MTRCRGKWIRIMLKDVVDFVQMLWLQSLQRQVGGMDGDEKSDMRSIGVVWFHG